MDPIPALQSVLWIHIPLMRIRIRIRLDVGSDANPDSDFLFDADPYFYLMRIRILAYK
jgi:hypothetical protein